jgi:homoserine/homoserine lactone efflux protein
MFFGAVACGLAALLAAATSLFTVLRWAGALYLMYLGFRLLASTFRGPSARVATSPSAKLAHRNLFLQGLLIQLTNPKALLFVSALLPQFINAREPALPQLAALLAITVAVDTVVLGSYALVAERGARRFGGSGFTRWLERVFGAALVFFGVRVLLARK